tara:strand:- start:849 stop:1529 length:681 start_codon:yes stop_codon:yes gene_type:complete
MNLNNYYYYFKSVLSHKFCDDVIKHAKNKNKNKLLGTTGKQSKEIEKIQKKYGDINNKLIQKKLSKKTITDLKKQRNSNIVWLNEKWIYNQILPFVHEANRQAGWNFDWDWSEDIQFTIYKKNQFYDWHCDSSHIPYNNLNNLNYHNKIRKLSVTCSLSDPKDYKGGDLQFQFRNKDNPKTIITCNEILSKGSIVVFPSFVWHRVRPITKGTRHSLVLWNLGYPYK